MHIFSKDQQAFHLTRTRAEKWFTRINTLLVAVQLACWLCALIRTASNGSNSMRNGLFAQSNLDLREVYLVPGCVYNVTRTHAFFKNVTYSMSADNIGYFVSRGCLNIRYLMAVTGVHMVVSAWNRVWFETNTHEIRYHFVIFRKDMVTTWEILLMVMGLVLTFGIDQENSIMKDYLEFCNGRLYQGVYSSVIPYIELYVSYFISVGITGINLLVACYNMFKENPRKKLLKEDESRRQQMQDMMEFKAIDTNLRQTSSSNDAPGPVYATDMAPVGLSYQPSDPQTNFQGTNNDMATNNSMYEQQMEIPYEDANTPLSDIVYQSQNQGPDEDVGQEDIFVDNSLNSRLFDQQLSESRPFGNNGSESSTFFGNRNNMNLYPPSGSENRLDPPTPPYNFSNARNMPPSF